MAKNIENSNTASASDYQMQYYCIDVLHRAAPDAGAVKATASTAVTNATYRLDTDTKMVVESGGTVFNVDVKRMRVAATATEEMNTSIAESEELKIRKQRATAEVTNIAPNITMNYELGFDTHNDLFASAMGSNFNSDTGRLSANLISAPVENYLGVSDGNASGVAFEVENVTDPTSLFPINTYFTIKFSGTHEAIANQTHHYRILQRTYNLVSGTTYRYQLLLEGLTFDFSTVQVTNEFLLPQFNALDEYYAGDFVRYMNNDYYMVQRHAFSNNSTPDNSASFARRITDTDVPEIDEDYAVGDVVFYLESVSSTDMTYKKIFARAYKAITNATTTQLPTQGATFRDFWSEYNEYDGTITSYSMGQATFHDTSAFISLIDSNTANPINGEGVLADTSYRRQFNYESYIGDADSTMADHVLYEGKYYRARGTTAFTNALPTDATHWEELTSIKTQTYHAYDLGDVVFNNDEYRYVNVDQNPTIDFASMVLMTPTSNVAQLHDFVSITTYEATNVGISAGMPGPEQQKLVYKLSGMTPTYYTIRQSGLQNTYAEADFDESIAGVETSIGSGSFQVASVHAWTTSLAQSDLTSGGQTAYIYDPDDPTQVYYWTASRTIQNGNNITTFAEFVAANYDPSNTSIRNIHPVVLNVAAHMPQGVVEYAERTNLTYDANLPKFLNVAGAGIYRINADITGNTSQFVTTDVTMITVMDYIAPVSFSPGEIGIEENRPNTIYYNIVAAVASFHLDNPTYFTAVQVVPFYLAAEDYRQGDVVYYMSGGMNIYRQAKTDVLLTSNHNVTDDAYFDDFIVKWQHATYRDSSEYVADDYVISQSGILYRCLNMTSSTYTEAQIVEGDDWTAIAARNNSPILDIRDTTYEPSWSVDQSYLEGAGVYYDGQRYGVKETVFDTEQTDNPEVATDTYGRMTKFSHAQIGNAGNYNLATSLGDYVYYLATASSDTDYLRIHNPALHTIAGSSFSQFYDYFSRYNIYSASTSYNTGDIVYLSKETVESIVQTSASLQESRRTVAAETPFRARRNNPTTAPMLDSTTNEPMLTNDWLPLAEYSDTQQYRVSGTDNEMFFRVGSVAYATVRDSIGTQPPVRYDLYTGSSATDWAQPYAIRNGITPNEFMSVPVDVSAPITVVISERTGQPVSDSGNLTALEGTYLSSFIRNGEDDFYYNMEIRRGNRHFFYYNVLLGTLGLNFATDGFIGGEASWMAGGVKANPSENPVISSSINFNQGVQNSALNSPITTGSKITGFFVRHANTQNLTDASKLRKQTISDVGYTSIEGAINLNIPDTNVIGHDGRYDPRRSRFDLDVTLNILYSTNEPFIGRLLNASERVFEMAIEAKDANDNYLIFTFPSLQITDYSVTSASSDGNQTAIVTCRATSSNAYDTTLQLDRIPNDI